MESRGSQLSSPVHFQSVTGAMRESQSSWESKQTAYEMETVETEAGNDIPDIKIRTEWLGTSKLYFELSLDLQYKGQLDSIITYRKAIVHDLTNSPYDPLLYLELSYIDTKLGFCDTALTTAYRGIELVKLGLGMTYHPTLGVLVRNTVSHQVAGRAKPVVGDHLRNLYVKLYRSFFNGCLGTSAYWDGLLEMKNALKIFPGDTDLVEFQKLLLQGFRNRNQELVESGTGHKEILVLTRTGGIYTKTYPWLDKNLNFRTPELMDEVNKDLGAGNCKVGPMVFGPPVFGPDRPPNLPAVLQDMGPLGIFATRDIKGGEIILADKTLTGLSLTPSRILEHCDACHAILAFPYIHRNEIITPSCCGKVAFCSQECYSTAANGYHKFVCGKDIDFLYENLPSGDDPAGTRWRPVMFLRIMAIVLADRQADKAAGRTSPHILQHPLLARMTAAYAPPEMYCPVNVSDYQVFENVIAPTQILILLGINIFTDTEFQPAVIQTIYWRIENNANRSTYNLKPKNFPKPSVSGRLKAPSAQSLYCGLTEEENAEISEEGATNMVAINPNYLFLNHSCEANVTWYGSVPDPSAGPAWLLGVGGEIHKAGSSTIFCKAGRDIKKGEELKISYVGNPMVEGELTEAEEGDLTEVEKDLRDRRWAKRKWMEKWFEGGCGCDVCERENKVDAKAKAKAEALEAASLGARDGDRASDAQ